ncbi:hypothetical protein LTR78_009320 [Recurvomyces mirabilis]|uniref:Uncharacterized protein n=1 Tax=Recurvomyces mirabilis TaxID=574656 RepID=A0AAE0TTU5_9PEZI|nr:hypothetical protein LTR78_009320 [Recurvomyces mirabilis]KAK5156119.1 hypothetical protein LTS14_005006 [Recurvomyces mirabilis]
MGADSQMPYLYANNESHKNRISYPYSHFNPKAVTEASYARLSQASETKPKQEGPLINYNRHPDNYEVWQGRQQDYKPLPKGTKKAVVVTRWVQFALRLHQEVVALGLLVLTVVLKGTSGAETYLLRIPQAWDSLITLYAIYHLIRPAKARTPASSYSYHTFAMIMDTCLIPLYVYIALVVNANAQYPPPQYQASGDLVPGNWRYTSLLVGGRTTPEVILLIVWTGAIGAAALHLLSAGIDLYLIITFRKIANLPPDMNPLEDNLTARKSVVGSKHKHKNSEMTVTTTGDDMTLAERKRLAHMSGSTLSIAEQSRLSTPAKDDDRNVPFGHSRNGSQANLAFSPHNPDSARWSRHQFEGQQQIYREAGSPQRRSRYEIRPDGKLDVRTRGGSQSPSKRDSRITVNEMDLGEVRMDRPSKRDSRITVNEMDLGDLRHSNLSSNNVASAGYGRAITPPLRSPAMPNAAGDKAAQGQEQSTKLLNDNWYVLDAEDDEYENRPPVPAKNGYMAVRDRHDSFMPVETTGTRREHARELMPKPLGMHPPTPPQDTQFPDPSEDYYSSGAGVERNPTNATQTSSIYSQESATTAKASGTPKGKYYGDLAAATRSILSQASNTPPPTYASKSRTPSPDKMDRMGGNGRVVSRTGADIADENVLFLHPHENGSKQSMRGLRNRDVSGKIAEEGRGGNGNWRGSWGSRGY